MLQEILSILGSIDHAKADYESASSAFEQALDTEQSLNDLDYSDEQQKEHNNNLATYLGNCGAAALKLGKHEEARQASEKALELDRSLSDADTTNLAQLEKVAIRHTNLASVLEKLLVYDQARDNYQNALAIWEGVGYKSPKMAFVLHNLANLEITLGNLQEARPLILRAIDLFERTNVGDHTNTAASIVKMGKLLYKQESYKEAIGCLLKAKEMLRGKDNRCLAECLTYLGSAYLARSDRRLAITRFAEAFAALNLSGFQNKSPEQMQDKLCELLGVTDLFQSS